MESLQFAQFVFQSEKNWSTLAAAFLAPHQARDTFPARLGLLDAVTWTSNGLSSEQVGGACQRSVQLWDLGRLRGRGEQEQLT